jgi:hypothetical protein
MPKPSIFDKKVNFYLRFPDIETLNRISKKERITKSELLRRALDMFFDEYEKSKKPPRKSFFQKFLDN